MTHEVKWHLKLTANYFRRTADDLDRIYKAMTDGDVKALRVIRRYYQTIRDYPLQSDPKRAEHETALFICDIIDLFQIESRVKGGTETWTEMQS